MKQKCPFCGAMLPMRFMQCEGDSDHWHTYIVCICWNGTEDGVIVNPVKLDRWGHPFGSDS